MIIIYTKKTTPRLDYVCNFIFCDYFGLNFQIINEYLDTNEPFINYSETKQSNGIFIVPGGLLENEIPEPDQLNPKWINNIPFLFHDSNSDCGFDVFSAVFFCLSRYEEYNSYVPDQHGRFPATESLAYRHNFLHLPVVDLWVLQLKTILQQRYPELKFTELKFKFHSTIDIDNAFKYKGKNIIRMAGAGIKEILAGKANQLPRRINFLLKKDKDPFDAYDFQAETSRKFNVALTYFVLFTFPGQYDKSLPATSKQLKQLIRQLRSSAQIGIHPSYYSSERLYRLEEEISMLSDELQDKIKISRQHFLRFKLPITFLQLLASGITTDYSMGYSTHNGFRAGTCVPFLFYNLAEEKTSSLRMVPFQIMDSVFYDHKGLSANEAMKEIKEIVSSVKLVKGQLVSVWHDRSFDDIEYPGWRNAYVQLHQLCSE